MKVIMKKSERKNIYEKLEWGIKIQEKAIGRDGKFEISGVAINATTSRNGVIYLEEELEKAAESLNGKPVLKDHNNSVESIVGRVVQSTYDSFNKSILFRAAILDEDTQEKIRDGRITNVSVGAIVGDAEETEEGIIARDIEFLEISLVSIPGVVGAMITSIDEALSAKILKQEVLTNKICHENPVVTEGKTLKDLYQAKEDAEKAVLVEKLSRFYEEHGIDTKVKMEVLVE